MIVINLPRVIFKSYFKNRTQYNDVEKIPLKNRKFDFLNQDNTSVDQGSANDALKKSILIVTFHLSMYSINVDRKLKAMYESSFIIFHCVIFSLFFALLLFSRSKA